MGVVCIQEHATPKGAQEGLRRMAAKERTKLEIGPCDPDALKPAAGVAVAATRAMKLAALAGLPSSAKALAERGRLGAYVVDSGAGFPLLLFTLYGWTGGAEKAEARGKTSELVSAALA
eukprot:4720003-Alexandrium_andersonii.AAC.1